MTLKRLHRISFETAAAIVTSMALVTGLSAIKPSRSIVIAALLIAALADNLSDALSIHIYQESERLERREAFIGTTADPAARLLGCLTFAALVAVLPSPLAVTASIICGTLLLMLLTYLLARDAGSAS
ncbi:MAG TPA: hypothetical protein VMT29_15205 [Steroidobacteraceae bacterium]|jgi:VIT1/CCC1 family predicted Fe2+/Mn2+ transporter|nr:hypothetical protein [Steroidobacteraceae bacterium]